MIRLELLNLICIRLSMGNGVINNNNIKLTAKYQRRRRRRKKEETSIIETFDDISWQEIANTRVMRWTTLTLNCEISI